MHIGRETLWVQPLAMFPTIFNRSNSFLLRETSM